MRQMRKILVVFLTGALTASMMAGCGDKKASEEANTEVAEEVTSESVGAGEDASMREDVEKTLMMYEDACKSGSVEDMLKCIDSGVADSMAQMRFLLNWCATNNNSDEVIMDAMLISLMAIDNVSVDMKTLHMEYTDEDIELVSDDIAKAYVTVSLDSVEAGKQGYEGNKEIRLYNPNGDAWYITGFSN